MILATLRSVYWRQVKANYVPRIWGQRRAGRTQGASCRLLTNSSHHELLNLTLMENATRRSPRSLLWSRLFERALKQYADVWMARATQMYLLESVK